MHKDIDAILIVSFGGPEKPDDVMPFLRRVTAGRGVPDDRLAVVAKQYEMFGGVSPINEQTRALIDALQEQLDEHGPHLPVYWGNRNWYPFLEDTMKQMVVDGVHHAVAFATSAYSSYSSCRQYKEDVYRAQVAAGAGAPLVTKIRQFFNHPGFVETMARNVEGALTHFDENERGQVHIAFTAHSIPSSMAESSRYEEQLREASKLVAERIGTANWELVFQSRSGSPRTPWLEPDISDHLEALHEAEKYDVVMVPIGFISDHMEVKYDLDTLAMETAAKLEMNVVRAETVGVDPQFVDAVRDLINETIDTDVVRQSLGDFGIASCQGETCCPAPQRPRVPAH